MCLALFLCQAGLDSVFMCGFPAARQKSLTKDEGCIVFVLEMFFTCLVAQKEWCVHIYMHV